MGFDFPVTGWLLERLNCRPDSSFLSFYEMKDALFSQLQALARRSVRVRECI